MGSTHADILVKAMQPKVSVTKATVEGVSTRVRDVLEQGIKKTSKQKATLLGLLGPYTIAVGPSIL